jgi:hypothetical protein
MAISGQKSQNGGLVQIFFIFLGRASFEGGRENTSDEACTASEACKVADRGKRR